MILIVDSGSTKSDWISVDVQSNQQVDKILTKGLNPTIIKETEILKILNESSELMTLKSQVSHVFFYGAGCGTEKPRQLLNTILQNFFSNAYVEVKEDTFAAVRATINFENEAAVVCILGTGSNCSFFDGTHLKQRVTSLGYSIMDDAAGNYYGKQLLRDYFFNHMPENLKALFQIKYNVDADNIKFNLYKQPHPNAYLASFAEFMFSNSDSEYIKNLLKKGLREFSKNMILQFPEEIKTVPVHFAGSIAHFSKEEIFEVAKEFNFKVGNIVRRPIDGLVTYHMKQLGSWK
ncbi:N-acetylglucosamine kinase [Xanthomarina sp. GH4-25]|uniref:N-acetylglucosamine kinase n=1 Tax=Xanthomarina sp. GH4-25 TaxID=3349335 RepID=UPI000D681FE5|nr:N-acetylglucosamine kinase [Flavobacteriaceae bacterium LYZ1037]